MTMNFKSVDFKSNKGFTILCTLLLCVLLITLVASTALGAVSLDPKSVFGILVSKTTGIEYTDQSWSKAVENIVWNLRMPRTLLGVLAGAGFALAGIMMQALTKNPLANPYILGISSGATTGAVMVIVMGGIPILGINSPAVGAFAGALITSLVVFMLASRNGGMSSTRLVLIGVSISALFSSVTSFIIFTASDQNKVTSALFWMTGSLAGGKYENLLAPALGVGLSFIFIVIFSRGLNSLLLGENVAKTLGVNTLVLRRAILVLSSILTGFLVANTGIIGFVGLIIPHVARTIVGSDHKKVAILSVLLGPILVIWADVLARLIGRPEEIPLGVITAFLGAPFFIWLIQKNTYGFGGRNG